MTAFTPLTPLNHDEFDSIDGAEILEAHDFPLFELAGHYRKLHIPAQNLTLECIITTMHGHTLNDEAILNLVVASGYVAEDSDITFRHNQRTGLFYTYFNFQQHS